MAIPLFPILGAISSVANTAWDTYLKSKQSKDLLLARRQDKVIQDALATRVEKLEDTCLEQARLIGELSRDLEQFAKAIQSGIEENQRRQASVRILLFVVLGVSVVSLVIAIVAILR
jgi:hypothetical protein